MLLERSERARALAGLFMGSLLAHAEVAEAQPGISAVGPMVVALDYAAPSDCPSEARFRDRVEQSSASVRWGAPAEAARAYRVHIEGRAGGFAGRLYEAGKTEPRVLEAQACEELVDALALMLALSADAALAGASASNTAASNAPAADPSVVDAPAAEAVAESKVPPTTAKMLPPAAPLPAAPITLPEPARPPIRAPHVSEPHLLGLSAIALLNAAPDALWGPALSYERALGPVFSLRMEARVALGQDRAYETYGGVAPAGCLRLEGSLAQLVGCGGLMLGYLDVKGAEYSGGNQSPYSLAPLLGVKVRFVVGGVSLELGAELERAFIRRSYTLKRDGSTFETRAVGEVFQLGVGARL